jgi:hypothetical protein
MYVGENLRLPLYDHAVRAAGRHESSTSCIFNLDIVTDAGFAYSSQHNHVQIHVPIFMSKYN